MRRVAGSRTYAGVMKGTKFGAMVTPGDPDTSNLMWLLDWKASPEIRMPHGNHEAFNLRSRCDPRVEPSGSQRQLVAGPRLSLVALLKEGEGGRLFLNAASRSGQAACLPG